VRLSVPDGENRRADSARTGAAKNNTIKAISNLFRRRGAAKSPRATIEISAASGERMSPTPGCELARGAGSHGKGALLSRISTARENSPRRRIYAQRRQRAQLRQDFWRACTSQVSAYKGESGAVAGYNLGRRAAR